MPSCPQRLSTASLAAIAILFSFGCSPELSDVQGSVNYNGTAVEKGVITFTPTGEFGSIVGCNIENGKFSAKGVFPGQNIIEVAATRNVTFSQNTQDMATTAPPSGPNGVNTNWRDPADVIPRNAEGNNVPYDFVPGKNTMDLQLSSPKTP